MATMVATELPRVDSKAPAYTWEQAVEWLRGQPGQEDLVRACYFDDPLLEAAERFATSAEWQAVRSWLPHCPGSVLDLGAGRGISSYALAQDGWDVTALEPDPSPLVGCGAIRQLAAESALSINILERRAEALPFADASFDLIYGRQVLHHTSDLSTLCPEIARVLRPGGRFIATREHVISKPDDLRTFLDSHPLHRLYGGEHAYMLTDYRNAIQNSGLRLASVLGLFDSIVNYFPMTYAEWRDRCRRPLARFTGRRLATVITDERHSLGQWLLHRLARHVSVTCDTPGRLYSFIARKPS